MLHPRVTNVRSIKRGTSSVAEIFCDDYHREKCVKPPHAWALVLVLVLHHPGPDVRRAVPSMASAAGGGWQSHGLWDV
jgi:hypothetical protein